MRTLTTEQRDAMDALRQLNYRPMVESYQPHGIIRIRVIAKLKADVMHLAMTPEGTYYPVAYAAAQSNHRWRH